MINKITCLIFFFSVLLYACENNKQQRGSFDFPPPEVVEIKGYVVQQDKTAPPEIIPAKEIKSKANSKPTVINLNSNVHFVGKPKIVSAGAPKICVPGEDGFSLPQIVSAIDNPFAAGAPEITVAKEPQINNNNVASFSTFKVLQGLKTNDIFPMMQDKAGNLWIACFEGGVCKYDGRSFTNYTTAQGLSNDDVWSMMEDSKGNLWFGTLLEGGLNKFDGKSFTHYTTKQGLSGTEVLSILEDKNGNLWFGTGDGGVNKYDGKTFAHYTTKQGLAGNHVRTIIEDNEGNLWFATRGGISKFDGKSFSNYTIDQGLSNADIMCILQDRKGDFWFSTYGGGVNRFDGRIFENYSVAQGLPDNHVYNMLEDKTGNLWFAMYDEYVIKYDGKSFTQFGIEQGLSNSKVHSILEDNTGNLWFGTNGGLSKYNGKIFTHFNSGDGFSQKVIIDLHEDEEGNIWTGIYGDGIKKLNNKSVSNYTTKQGLTDDNIMCVSEDNNDVLLIGTHFGGLNKFDGNTFSHFENFPPNIAIWAILKDKKGNTWIGTSKGLYKFDGNNFTHFGTAQGLSWESIISICEDKNGDLWLGTELDGVINKLDLSAEQTGHYFFTHYNIKQGSSLSFVYSIIQDKTGNLWFGTSNSGVLKFDGKSFTRYTTAQGLSNNSVNSVVEDKTGTIWFLTENGLCKMPAPENNELEKSKPNKNRNTLFKTYLYADGFFGVGSHYNSMILGRDGNIWAGAGNWLTCYHPEGDIADTIPLTIQLTGVALFDETINWREFENKKDTVLFLRNGTRLRNFNFTGLTPWYNQPENLQIAHDNSYITFQFIGIATNRPGEVRYQYFLEGLDNNWSAVTDKPEATYNNLPPGEYTFKVKAANSEGYWSKELNYSFTILPAWWQTWWFMIASVACIIFLVYALMRWRIQQRFHLKLERSEKEKQLAELQQQKTELEMQALRAQMNPHFIFNSLNSVNRFILQNNRMQASEYLTKFSRLVRLILQNSQASLITLESELESLKLYLELEELRFDDHFTFKIIVDDELDPDMIKIPPLLIQPYTENAIWHGLMHKEERGHLQIHLFKEEDMLCCKITDDGVGRKKATALKSQSTSTYKSMGMSITADRIAMLSQQNPLQSTVHVTDIILPDGNAAGTEVLLKIPLMYFSNFIN
ncbi:hypothetical protein BH10BAC2_BH10BAC2_42910 [soil metagenome]